MPRRVQLFVYMIAAVAAGALAASGLLTHAHFNDQNQWIIMALAALAFTAAQMLPVPIPKGSGYELASFEEALVVPLVVVLAPSQVSLAMAAGVLIGYLFERVEPIKILFNLSQLVLATLAAAHAFQLLAGDAPALSLHAMAAAATALLAMFFVNQVLVATVMALVGANSWSHLIKAGLVLKSLMWIANAAFGVLLVFPVVASPWLLVAALIPLVLMHFASRIQFERLTERERLKQLQTLTQDISREREPVAAARRVVEAARHLVGATYVELYVEHHPQMNAAVSDSESDEAPKRPSTNADVMLLMKGSSGLDAQLRVWAAPSPAPELTLADNSLLVMLARHGEIALDNVLLLERTFGQKQKMAQIFDNTSEGLIVLSSSGRIQSWNPAMQELSAFSAEQVLDSPIALLSPQMGAITEQTQAGEMDAVLGSLDGSRHLVRASYAPFRMSAEQGTSWVVVVHDVTRERETERLKDDFVATVSHELRTPLTAIKGFVDTMRRDDVELVPDQISMFLDIMSQQSDRLERLINDLLDMSAIENGRPLKVKTQPVEMASDLRRAIQAFEHSRPEAVVQLSVPDNSIMALVDPDRLQQVVTNLLENAAKHAAGNKNIDVTLTSTDEVVEVRVRDHGVGIAPHDIRRIFDRFFIAADSVTRVGGGAGLGLYISQRLVEAMQGKIWAESVLGEGATFVIQLPLLTGASQGGVALPAPSPAPSDA